MLKALHARQEVTEFLRELPRDSSMGDHLLTIFDETLALEPKLILEAGVWNGLSTFALSRAASVTGATVISIDIGDFSEACDYERWLFVQESDLLFADRFETFCEEHELEPQIDVLFIDALHTYEHVSREIALWFPFLADHAKAMFHDTNARKTVFRKDGTRRHRKERDLERGIIGALEDYFERPFEEQWEFILTVGDWTITHHPYTHGLTICEQRKPAAKEEEVC